jgi:hypothetical protein
MHLSRLTLLAALLAAPMLFSAAMAQADTLSTGASHRGVIAVGSYQLFPENRSGNAVYGDNTLLLTLPGQVIQDVVALPAKNKFIYLARQGDTRTVGVRNGTNDPTPRINEVSPGYYYVVTVLDGVAYKKLVRINGANLVDLLPSSKTTDGITVGPTGVLFFHIGKSVDGPDGKPRFSIGIHFAPFEAGKVRHLAQQVENTLPSVGLKWMDDTRFQYTLTDGTSTTLSTSDLQ